jgi:mannitol/fructose-specific phosphotransferase system IIA component (Ntr-type)
MQAPQPSATRGVLLCCDSTVRRPVARLATVVAGMYQAEIVELPRQTAAGLEDLLSGRATAAAIAAAQDARPGLCALVADWSDAPSAVQAVLAAANRLQTPCYIARQALDAQPRRIVVASSGGVHALHVMALAEALGQHWGLPVSLLHLDPRTLEDDAQQRRRQRLENILARSFVLGLTIEVGRVPDLAGRIDSLVGPDDLLLIGAPHFGVAASHFEGSLPERLERIRRGPMIMCLAEPPRSLPLRDFMWEANVCVDVAGLDRDGVIRLLAGRLCESGVLPEHLRGEAIAAALAREAQGATAVDCQTALPHALLPSYDGVAAALAICPAGVAFADGENSRFVFLLVSSASSYESYLGALARIAGAMMRDETRSALLAATAPEEAMRALAKE